MRVTRGPARTALIVCGAIAREVKDLAKVHGWQLDLKVLPATHHMRPNLILRDVEAQVQKLQGHSRIVVGYGACGAHGLDELLDRNGAVRIPGAHCYEMLAGPDFERMLADQPGTFFLTDFLVEAWDRLVVDWWRLRDRPKLKGVLFRNYARTVFLNTRPSHELRLKAQAIADELGLPLEIRWVGYGQLESRLCALMDGALRLGEAFEATVSREGS